MDQNNKYNIELKDLVDRLLDGEGDSKDADQLSRLLESDQGLCVQYVDQIELHARLSWRGSFLGKLDNHKFDQLQLEAILSNDQASEAMIPAESSRLTLFLNKSISSVGDIISKPTSLSVAMAFVVIVSILATLALISTRDNPIVVSRDDEPLVVAKRVATITKMRDCKWKNSFFVPAVGYRLHETNLLELAAGQLQVTFDTGAIVNLQGPVSLKVQSPNTAELIQGKILAKVSQEARGFTIETPSVKVVDLGTEFGVHVDKDRYADVHVFAGHVQTHTFGVDGKELEVFDMYTNDSKRFGPVGLQVPLAVTEKKRLQESFWQTPDTLRITEQYVQAVKQLSPICYWRFKEIRSGMIRNEMHNRDHLKIHGNVRLTYNGGSNHTLLLSKTASNRFLQTKSPVEHLTDGDYTIEMWIKPHDVHDGTLLGFIDPAFIDKKKKGHLSLLALLANEDKSNATIRFLHRQDKEQQGTSVYATRGCSSKRWHHLVAIRKDHQISLYLDGKQISQAQDLSNAHKACYVLIGQRRAVMAPLPQRFNGEIDEVAIYRSALTLKQVKRHFSLGQPRPVNSK